MERGNQRDDHVQRVTMWFMLILSLVMMTGTSASAAFDVLDVALSPAIVERSPANPIRPAAHCEKDKNGQSTLPTVLVSEIPKIFFWTRIASSEEGLLRHTWHVESDEGWETVSEVNLAVRPSPGYRTWSSKVFRSERHIGNWMIVVAPADEPEKILCITRFRAK